MNRLSRLLALLTRLLLLIATPNWAAGQPPPPATLAYNAYIAAVESRLARQHAAPETFLAPLPPAAGSSLRSGQIVIEPVALSGPAPPGALLHHWRATAFAPGARVPDLERLLRDVPGYPRLFAPQVVRAAVLARQPDRSQICLRVLEHHVLTVVLDTGYDVTFGRLDPRHAFSSSVSTRIAEIASPNTPAEHPLDPAQEHGFLWRQNTYWSFEERDGGLYLQVESISLSRSIPHGLGWAVQPFVQSIPRDTLQFTLHAVLTALIPNLRPAP